MREAKVCNQCKKVLSENEEDSHPDQGFGKRDTLIDLEASEDIEAKHVAEAVQYRSLDREAWFGT
ncbi:MAG: hypothetical protein NXI09_15585 [Bacteroidetes bacterium]|nr:hypothetical protein [Bacteroidota bacterium]